MIENQRARQGGSDRLGEGFNQVRRIRKGFERTAKSWKKPPVCYVAWGERGKVGKYDMLQTLYGAVSG